MATRFIFIRHGQSTWNEIGRWQGHATPPLSENGRAQALLLARRLSTPVIDPLWRERGIGALEGLTTEEIEQRFPEAWATRLTGPMTGVEGFETPESVLRRAETACAALLARHPGQSVAVVTHGGMILAILVHLLQFPPAGFARLTGGHHTAISQVVIDEGHARLVGLNDDAHLELLGHHT